MRGHTPIIIDKFNGLYDRGDPDDVPLDHFIDCNNIQFIDNAVTLRDGVGLHQDVVAPLGDILRIYNFITQDENTLLVLINGGDIYHIVDSTTVLGPILSIPEMTDFDMFPYAGRAYITPFTTYAGIERGLENDFLYVYLGDGTSARKAAGDPPINGGPAFAVSNGTGATDAGLKIFGVVYETDTGFLTAPTCFIGFTTGAANGVSFANIPVSPDSFVTARHIVATKNITNYNGNLNGYQFFFIPDGVINDNTTTTLSNITFFDVDLLEDASHLIDNFSEIPAGVGFGLYHNRLVLHTPFDDISLAYVSSPGEPEVINQIDGLIIAPLDGNPLTNAQELRDILYLFKRNRTVAYVDNGDVPSSWPMSVVDQAIGCPVHGIATVVDSGSSNIDFLIVASYKGIVLFNGVYANPELSWKVRSRWTTQDTDNFNRIQIIHDPIKQLIYTILPDYTMLVGNYSNGLDPKKIRWIPWSFDVQVNTIAFVNTNQLILGAQRRRT